MNIIQRLEAGRSSRFKSGKTIPEFRPGDTLRVGVKVVEGERTRIQNFEGVCIARANAALAFLRPQDQLRRGVERVFPLYSPNIKIRSRSSAATSARQALSARPHRKVGPDRRAARHAPPKVVAGAATPTRRPSRQAEPVRTRWEGGRCGGRPFSAAGWISDHARSSFVVASFVPKTGSHFRHDALCARTADLRGSRAPAAGWR